MHRRASKNSTNCSGDCAPDGRPRRLAAGTPRANWRMAALAVLLFAAAPASARWYQVEVVVFEHSGSAATGDEQWPELAELPDFSRAQELLVDLPALADEPALPGGAAMPIAFTPLGRGELRLAGVEQRLRSSADYRPLLAAGWRQPSFGVAGAKHIYLSDLGTRRNAAAGVSPTALAPGPALRSEGTVAIKVSNLLVIDVDFVYYHAGLPVRLRASRTAKLREIHYFDHPLFGVIVQVAPFALPEVPETTAVSGDEPVDEAAADGAAPAAQAPAAVND